MQPHELYLELMRTVRGRFDLVEALRLAPEGNFLRAEAAAVHARKIIEAIAFGCLVALDSGMKSIPRDARAQWNAESIFKRLRQRGLDVLPSPSVIRTATEEERRTQSVTAVIEGVPERRLNHDELIQMYQRLHAWLHELNPYTSDGHQAFEQKHAGALWADLRRLRLFVEKHFISIDGAGFMCVLADDQDGLTKVVRLDRG